MSFTINPETGEIACALHLQVPNVPTRGATQSRGTFVRSRRRRKVDLPSLAQPLRGHSQASQQLLLSCSLLPTCPQLLPALVGEEVGQLPVLREGYHHLIVECLLLRELHLLLPLIQCCDQPQQTILLTLVAHRSIALLSSWSDPRVRS